ncbi:hypothetical protein C0431_01400 [bacterium]|nr:hypothetical protein [bacterium]
MPARKKKESVEEAQQVEKRTRSPKAKDVVPAEPVVAEVTTVAVPADVLTQLMAQIQTLTAEVGELRTQVVAPRVTEGVNQPESGGDQGEQLSYGLGELSQEEIDQANAHPDMMPDDFWQPELDEEVVEIPALNVPRFEEKNPGLLAEVAQFNATTATGVSLEVTQEEIDLASEHPDEMPAEFYANDSEEDYVQQTVDSQEIEAQFPGLMGAIEAFNSEDDEEDASLTPEESGALLSGFDEVMAEVVEEDQVDESTSTEVSSTASAVDFAAIPDDGELSADQIAAMFAGGVAEVSVDDLATIPDDGELSADQIAAMFAGGVAEVSVDDLATIPDDGELSADQIAAMFASTDADETDVSGFVAAESDAAELSDDEIAAAIELGAVEEKPEEPEIEDDFDLDSLTEEDLVALVKGNIDAQAEALDAAAEAKAAEEAEAANRADGVMSAAEIAALLDTPDEPGEVVPSSSSAMSDEELRALLGAPVEKPVAQEKEENTFGFVGSDPVNFSKPQAQASEGSSEIGAIKAVPAHFAVRAMALPIRFQEGKILCQVAEPIDRVALDRMSQAIGFGILVEPAPIDQVIAGLREAYAEVQDYHARFAVMSGAQRRPSLREKMGDLWKKIA